jgi:protein O-mannosyl-transferase
MKSTSAWAYLAIIVLVMAVYFPVTQYDFLAFDDGLHVTENPLLKSFHLQNVREMWVKPYQNLYFPVTLTAWSGLAQISRWATESPTLAPGLFHSANLILHILNGILVFLILSRLIRGTLCPLMGALFFALHPLQVETVAWVTGFKDALAGFFALVSLWFFVRWRTKENPINFDFLPCLGFWLLALLSKGTSISLPLLFLVLDIFVFHRLRRLKEDPIFWSVLVSGTLGFAFMNMGAQKDLGVGVRPTPLLQRPLIVADSLLYYLSKILWPFSIGVDLGRTPSHVLAHAPRALYAFIIGILGLVLLIPSTSRLFRGGILLFGAWIAPISGIVPFIHQYISTVACRYAYVALLGPSLVFAWTLSTLSTRAQRCVGFGVAFSLTIFLSVLSRENIRHWNDDFSLFSHNTAVIPNGWAAHYKMGELLTKKNRLQEAVPYFEKAHSLNPAEYLSSTALGTAYLTLGKWAEAKRSYESTLAVHPNLMNVNFELALLLEKEGASKKAATHLDNVRAGFDQLFPFETNSSAESRLLLFKNKWPKKPSQAHIWFAMDLVARGKKDPAKEALRSALELDPNSDTAKLYLSLL